MKQIGLKQALSSQNIELVTNKFKEFKSYMLSLRKKMMSYYAILVVKLVF